MLAGGESPLYIVRRLVRASVEDIGWPIRKRLCRRLRPRTSTIFLGSPEGELALAQAVIYLGHRAEIECGVCPPSARRNGPPRSTVVTPPAHILERAHAADAGFGIWGRL
jgi:putative ATPase